MIKTADDLAWLRDGVNDGTIASGDADAKLMNDIDMGGIANWVPIGYIIVSSDVSVVDDRSYSSIFDGRVYTIANLKITENNPHMQGASASNNANYIGLFGVLKDATIRNLRISNASVTLGTSAGFLTRAGLLAADIGEYTLIENCTVSGGTVDIKAGVSDVYAGGLLGFTTEASTVQNCVVSGTKIDIAGRILYAGGITASFAGGWAVKGDLSIRNCTVSGNDISAISAANTVAVGGIAGNALGGDTNNDAIDNCVSLNNTLKSNTSSNEAAGGIAGLAMTAFINNCTVSGSPASIRAATPQVEGALIGDAMFVRGANNYFAAGLLANGTDNAIGEDFLGLSSITSTMFDYGATSPDQLPVATVLLDDVMKVVSEGASVDLSVVTYPGTSGDVAYAWDGDYGYVSLSAAAGQSIDVTGVTAGMVDYVENVPTALTLALNVTDLRCAFRVDAVPVPPAPPCEGECGSGCAALPFEWLAVLLLPCAVYLLATRKNWIS